MSYATPDQLASFDSGVTRERRRVIRLARGSTVLGSAETLAANGRRIWSVDVEIPAGKKGTAATVAWMGRLALEGSRSPGVIDLARRIVAGTGHKDYVAQADAILQHMKRTVQYLRDPRGLEHVQTPSWTLYGVRAGDCDDHATAIAALALALGFEAGFRTVGATASHFSHVYAVVNLDGRWVALDSTIARSYLGWEPEGVALSKTWRVNA